VDVRLQCDDTMAAVSHSFNFGHLPIMLMVVTLSHLCLCTEFCDIMKTVLMLQVDFRVCKYIFFNYFCCICCLNE
jgi:hypothetical protein